MREYKIVNSDLGFKIYRQKGDKVEWLDIHGNRNKDKGRSKIYYHRDDAIGALVVRKAKGEKKIKVKSKPEVPKKSWGELS